MCEKIKEGKECKCCDGTKFTEEIKMLKIHIPKGCKHKDYQIFQSSVLIILDHYHL